MTRQYLLAVCWHTYRISSNDAKEIGIILSAELIAAVGGVVLFI